MLGKSHKTRMKWFGKPYVWVLCVLIFVALFSDFLANGLPLYAKKEGRNRFPVFEKKLVDWNMMNPKADLHQPEPWKSDKNITNQCWPLIPYSPNQTDRYNDRFQKPHWLRKDTPTGFKHWFGTDELGHDVASVLIHGTSVSFFIGVFSMILASLIGILLGATAGFFGDYRLKGTFPQITCIILALFLCWFYAVQLQLTSFSEALTKNGILVFMSILKSVFITLAIVLIIFLVSKKISFFNNGKRRNIPIDFVLSRFIEFMVVIPKIILILAVAAIAKPSIFLPTLIIGFTAWPSIARFTRAEMLHVREMEYMISAETFGLKTSRLFFIHALPNSLNPIPSLIAFGIAGAVLAESTLSFLGIGIPPETFTWGKLLSQGRLHPQAWWVTLLPGLLIFFTVTCFHKLGEDLQDKNSTQKSFLRYFI